ncbi:MAG: flavodoxin family protein [Reyranellaceae bacterium]
MRTLVVFYSLSGNSRAVGEAIASALSADVEEIRCDRYRLRILDALKAAYDGWSGKLPTIGAPQRSPSDYDLVVVGGPIWAWHAATPVRAYLRQLTGQFRSVAFFLTHGGSPPDRAFGEMETLADATPQAVIAIRESDVKARRFQPVISAFVSALRRDEAA